MEDGEGSIVFLPKNGQTAQSEPRSRRGNVQHKCSDPGAAASSAASRSPEPSKREGLVKPEMMAGCLSRANVVLRGGGLDESPDCYKRLPRCSRPTTTPSASCTTLTPLGVRWPARMSSIRTRIDLVKILDAPCSRLMRCVGFLVTSPPSGSILSPREYPNEQQTPARCRRSASRRPHPPSPRLRPSKAPSPTPCAPQSM